MKSSPRWTCFFPVFDEIDGIEAHLDSFLRTFSETGDTYEIIAVDDGSRDGTEAVLDRYSADGRIRVARHSTNEGYGVALRTGIAASRGEYVFYTDADGQFDPADFHRLRKACAPDTAVLGRRTPRAEGLARRFQTAVFHAVIWFLFGKMPDDVNASFKIFPGDAVRKLTLRSRGAFIDAEILLGLRRSGVRFVEFDVAHRTRSTGISKFRGMGHALRVLREAFAYRLRSFRSI